MRGRRRKKSNWCGIFHSIDFLALALRLANDYIIRIFAIESLRKKKKKQNTPMWKISLSERYDICKSMSPTTAWISNIFECTIESSGTHSKNVKLPFEHMKNWCHINIIVQSNKFRINVKSTKILNWRNSVNLWMGKFHHSGEMADKRWNHLIVY